MRITQSVSNARSGFSPLPSTFLLIINIRFLISRQILLLEAHTYFFLRNSYHITVPLRTTISKRKRPQDRKRKRAFIRTHSHGETTTILSESSKWSLVEKEGERNVKTKRKMEEREREREREHFLYEEARLFTGAGTKWKMLDSTRSERVLTARV